MTKRILYGPLTLSLALGFVCASAQPPDAQQEPSAFNTREVFNYPLTMEKVDKWGAATTAVITYAKNHPDVADKAKEINESHVKSVDDLVNWAKMHANEYVAIIESNGIPFREYLLVSGALASAWIALEMAERNVHASGDGPPVNPANIAFVKANKPKLQAMFKQYQALANGSPQNGSAQ